MLAFITSLRHPQNSADYGRVESLLRETLVSVTEQTSDDFVVIVVGNQRPQFVLPDKVHFVPVEFDPPAPPNGPRTDRAPFVRDKGTKIGIGLLAAREFSPDHVMIFDADDFVHAELAEYVGARKGHSGWMIDRGWMYSRARNAYRRQNDFNRTCGTCYILPYEAYEVPTDLDVSATQQEVVDGFGERLEAMLGAHRHAVEWHRARGRTLEPLPMRAAVYHVDTGENHSGKAMTGVARPLGPRIRRSFRISPQRGPVSTIWSSVGPVAIWESVSTRSRVTARRLQRAVRKTLTKL
ncbi:hypothetical protein [Microbacterium sp. NPDC064584]|uniref:hypothetical protein n=1 Tax=Microbacterium sp. NPDC064584 TaxID=3155817 RepID=UPI00341E26F4